MVSAQPSIAVSHSACRPEFIRGSKIKGYRIFTVSMHQLGEKLLRTPVRKTKSGKAAMAKTGKAAMSKTALKNIPVKKTPPKKISPQKTKIKMRAKRTACLDQFPAAMREASPTSPPPCPTPAHSLPPCNPTTNGEAAHGDSECKVHTPENGKCQASGQLQARCNAGSMTHAPFHPAKKSCPEAVKYYTPTPSQPIVHDALPTPIHALMLQRSGAFSPAQSTAAAFPASDACCAIYSGEDKSCASVYQAFQNDSGVDFPFDASLPYVEVELWKLEMVMSNRSSLAPPPAVDGMAFAQASEILLLDGLELVLEDCADMDFDFESGTE